MRSCMTSIIIIFYGLFNDIVSSSDYDVHYEYWTRKDEKESGSGLISYNIPDLLGNTEENQEIFRIISVLAEIRTGYLQNNNQKSYSYSRLSW